MGMYDDRIEWNVSIPQSYSGIPRRGIKFNGDSLAVNKIAFSSNVNNEMRFLTLSSMDNDVLQKGNALKLVEHATGIVSAAEHATKIRISTSESIVLKFD